MMRSAILTQITRETDGQTDGIGVAYTRYAVARKKRGMKSMHIFKLGRLRGERLSYLSMYLLYIYIVFLSFSQKFFRSLRSLNCVLSST